MSIIHGRRRRRDWLREEYNICTLLCIRLGLRSRSMDHSRFSVDHLLRLHNIICIYEYIHTRACTLSVIISPSLTDRSSSALVYYIRSLFYVFSGMHRFSHASPSSPSTNTVTTERISKRGLNCFSRLLLN